MRFEPLEMHLTLALMTADSPNFVVVFRKDGYERLGYAHEIGHV
jgi:hypothetical protein